MQSLQSLNFPIEIPASFLQVLNEIGFLPSSPNVLNTISKVEVVVFGNGYALYSRGMVAVVVWIYWVGQVILLKKDV